MKKRIIVTALFLVIGIAGAWANSRPDARTLPKSGVHNILSSRLPAALLEDIKKEYKGYWITELYEEGKSKRPSYSDQIIKLSSFDSKNWAIASTTIKAV